MLPKHHRLPLRERFVPEFQSYSPRFSLKVRANGSEISRFAFIVSKRFAKKAVDRNSTKRVFRLCIQSNIEKVKAGYDMLFVAKQSLSKADFESLYQEMSKQLEKKSLLKSN